MGTIEERAQMCVDKIGILGAYQGYIIGATEQKKIDDEENGKALLYCTDKTAERVKKEMIDKACEWFADYLFEIGYPDDWCRDSKAQMNGEQRFRKAMEGKRNPLFDSCLAKVDPEIREEVRRNMEE